MGLLVSPDSQAQEDSASCVELIKLLLQVAALRSREPEVPEPDLHESREEPFDIWYPFRSPCDIAVEVLG